MSRAWPGNGVAARGGAEIREGMEALREAVRSNGLAWHRCATDVHKRAVKRKGIEMLGMAEEPHCYASNFLNLGGQDEPHNHRPGNLQ